MIVIKFGGTSVGDADRVANAIEIVAERKDRDPIVVVSALSGLSLLTASLATRFGIFEGGLASARDPKYTVRPQRERLAQRAAENGATGSDGGGAKTQGPA